MLPSGLSMLWETVDPAAALRARFGFDDPADASAWCAGVLADRWGVAVGTCSRLVISDRNAIAWFASDHGDVVVKWSVDGERFEQLAASTRLLRRLAAQGVPVASPFPTRDGLVRAVLEVPARVLAEARVPVPARVLSEARVLSVAVLPELAGDWLDVTDPVLVRAAGACLARVHRALGPMRDAVPLAAPVTGFRARIESWLTDADRGVAPEASRQLRDLLAGVRDLDDDLQPVHNDFRAANLLTRDAAIVGVLDLDDVIVTHRVVDLAKASVYLATRFTDWGPTTPEVRAVFRAGYESVRALDPDEARWYEVLVLWLGLQAIPADDTAGWTAAVTRAAVARAAVTRAAVTRATDA